MTQSENFFSFEHEKNLGMYSQNYGVMESLVAHQQTFEETQTWLLNIFS